MHIACRIRVIATGTRSSVKLRMPTPGGYYFHRSTWRSPGYVGSVAVAVP